jgi:MoxR-like ATPase
MGDAVSMWKHASAINLEAMNRPEDYVMEDQDLRASANAALMLGKPLLLTGEAGIGKSQFAGWLALQLDLAQPLKFVVKSTTEARELFYHYDALARFHEAQVKHLGNLDVPGERLAPPANADTIDPRRYLTYNALGQAIVFSLGKDLARDKGLISGAMSGLMTEFPDKPRRSVVLIDEIDKAPRDVPNDMLDEIDHLSFTIRELGNLRVEANRELRPVVVMTSNSERDLPKPFLRRCVYYHMKFPEDPEFLARIVKRRVGRRFQSSSSVPGQAVTLFHHLRDKVGLRQKPGLAELLDFLSALAANTTTDGSLGTYSDLAALIKSTLLKDRQDQELSDRDWKSWLTQALGS